MAEPGSIAERVKQQADIVRLVGDYVRLKKSGQNFLGLCPFHSEKTPSFAVHPVKQIYHCFGCGTGGDIFKFVMEMERVDFPEALRLVAEKAGVRLPEQRPRTPEEAKATQLRTALMELNKVAAQFFVEQLQQTREGKFVRDYLHDRGLTDEIIQTFGLGYAPGTGDALLRRLRERGAKQEILEASGLVNKDPSTSLGTGERGFYDRFRRRVIFPIANESGRIVAFGGRALGDDQPKYLNSPETPVYSKSRVLYNLHRGREALRRLDYAILVEGYLDCIAVFAGGLANVVASCGTSLTELQVRLLARSTKNVVVSFDPDTAGRAATERSLNLLLEQGFQVRVLSLPAGYDPDSFVRDKGGEAYREELKKSLPYLDYLVERARAEHDFRSQEGKIAALNYLLPYLARVPNKIRRAEWATELAARLQIEEALLREELRRAATERRGEMKLRPEHKQALEASAVKPAERRLLQILLENEEIRADVLKELEDDAAHRGASLEETFNQVLALARAGEPLTVERLAETIGEGERRRLFEMAFESGPAVAGSLEEARSCLAAMRRRKLEGELRQLQSDIQEAERAKQGDKLRELLARKQSLHKALGELS
ncbi:DNA primase [Acidobacteriia bacterium AH_259_A11_L15]|nr:DNA primase [Acidobacteriia bacterium AH_259_A11_L15]